jgi:hypothetical protein
MAKKPTKYCTYPSKYAPGTWITFAQYVAEQMVERAAAKHSIKLPLKFWEDKRWASQFKYQMFLANKLKTIYSKEAIVNALKAPEMKDVYSLNAHWIIDKIIQREEMLLQNKPNQIITYEVAQTEIKPREPFKQRKSIRGLDD